MDFSVPLTRAEALALALSLLLIGAGIGAMLAGLPHPTLMQRNLSGVSSVLGLALLVGLLVVRTDRLWKLRTR
jgi:hypothetical protein